MTLLAGVAAALVCIGVSVLVLALVRSAETYDARDQIAGASDQVLSMIKQGGLPSVLRSRDNEAIQVVDAHGRSFDATPQLAGKPPMAAFRAARGMQAERTLCPPVGLKGCMIVLALKVSQPDGTWLIYAATPQVAWYGNNSTVPILVIGASVLTTAMMAAGTFLAVGKTLAPVGAIRRELEVITATGLDRRVPVPRQQDEIRRLAETVNDTLDRLEGAYERLRHFTSDASHDLRSPITAMRTQLEEALMYPADTDWPRMTEAVLGAVERLQALVTDLLAIARLDAGAPLARDPTDLAQLVEAELDRHPGGIKVVRKLQKGVFTRCDRLRLARLLTNLMDNAERHATSQIMVIVRSCEAMAIMEVIDDGAGIATELREVVFRRFTRLDASRSRDAGGTGLGLAIARQIAEAHQGTLTIEDSPAGARFVLRLPRYVPLLPGTPIELGGE
jgi:signal transduction histidine kinase